MLWAHQRPDPYTLAAERGNSAVAALADPLDPAVLRLVDAVCRAAEGQAEVAVCGEVASDETAVALLLGLGVRELSLVPAAVPMVQRAVREVDAATAARLAREALGAARTYERFSRPGEPRMAGRRPPRQADHMDRDRVNDWIAGYERAWRTPGTDALASLFAADASYQQHPYREPVAGLPAIVRMWEAERDGADEVFRMSSDIVAVEGDTAVVRLHVQYGDPVTEEFRDLWVVSFDRDGRCRWFEEWPFLGPR